MKKILSTTRRFPDGSISLTWPRKPEDNQNVAELQFMPIMGGPLVTAHAFRERAFDEVGPFGVTTWGYWMPSHEVNRATREAQEIMARSANEADGADSQNANEAEASAS